jgi:Tol biopolymer transport system component
VHDGPNAFSSIGRDGNLVASGFPVANDQGRRWKVRCALALYSRVDKKWRTYGEFAQVLTTAISPEASQIAFIAEEKDSESRWIQVLDADTGHITKLRRIVANSISWSPDGKRLAVDIPYENSPRIAVYDIGADHLRELEDGNSPSWSPTGDWIAYVDSSKQKIALVHPDGTGNRVVVDVSGHFWGYRYFGLKPIWAPDGKKLLLNEYKGDGDSQDVLMLDLSSGKTARMSRNGLPILGWASPTE